MRPNEPLRSKPNNHATRPYVAAKASTATDPGIRNGRPDRLFWSSARAPKAANSRPVTRGKGSKNISPYSDTPNKAAETVRPVHKHRRNRQRHVKTTTGVTVLRSGKK